MYFTYRYYNTVYHLNSMQANMLQSRIISMVRPFFFIHQKGVLMLLGGAL